MPSTVSTLLEASLIWLLILGACVGVPGLVVWGGWKALRWFWLGTYQLRFSLLSPYPELLRLRLEKLKQLPENAAMARPRDEALLKGVPDACRLIEQLQADFKLAEQAVSEKRLTKAKKLVGSLEAQAPKAVIELGALLTALDALLEGGGRCDEAEAERAVAIIASSAGYAKRFAKLHQMSWLALNTARLEKGKPSKSTQRIGPLNEALAAALNALSRLPLKPDEVEEALRQAESCSASYKNEHWEESLANISYEN